MLALLPTPFCSLCFALQAIKRGGWHIARNKYYEQFAGAPLFAAEQKPEGEEEGEAESGAPGEAQEEGEDLAEKGAEASTAAEQPQQAAAAAAAGGV